MPLFTYCSFLFLLLTMMFILFGLKEIKSVKIWYFLMGISLIFGVIAQVITWLAFGYILLIAAVTFFYCRKKNVELTLLLIVVSLPLFFHLPFTGFQNYPFLCKVRITPDAIPYSLYFNYDKTLLPIFIWGFSKDYINGKKLLSIIKRVFLYLLFLAPLILLISWYLQYVHFSPKWPVYTPVWMFVNLFFTCTAEEVLCREIIQGGVQRELKSPYKGYISIGIAAGLFGAMHYMGGINYILLATVAGLFYGHIFYKTKEIRSSVFLHFSLNALHFLLFTYPALEH